MKRSPLLWLYGLALVPRVAYLIVMRPPLEGYHLSVAANLVTHGFLGLDGNPSASYEPLYPLFLAGAQTVIGGSGFGVQLLKLAIDALGSVGLYLLAGKLTGHHRVGIIAGVLYALYPLLVRHALSGDESWLLSVLLIAFACAITFGMTIRHAAAAGAFLGFAILTRSMVAPVLVLTVAILVVRRRPLAAVTLAATTLAVTTPWLLHNYALNGSIWTTRSGENLLHANSRYADAILPEYNFDLLGAYVTPQVERDAPELLEPSRELELDRYYATLAFDEIRAHPIRTLRLSLSKAAYFFWPRLVPSRTWDENTHVVFEPDGRISVQNSPARPLWEQLGYTLSYTPVAVAAAFGVWRRRRQLGQDWMLWCIVATFVVVCMIYFPATRFRASMEFVLLFYAAVAADAWLPDPAAPA